jgi:tetratricopeptide (TPR) repeat protein
MLIAFAVSFILLADPATELNAQGETLAQHGDLNEALKAFRKAIEANPHFARGYYNEALALAHLRSLPSNRRPSKKSVLDAAEQAIHLDPKLREEAAQELPAVRTTFRGQKLLGRTIEKDTAAIAQGIVWRSRSGLRLDFLADGTVRFWTQPEWSARPPAPTGHWSVQGDRLTLVLSGKAHDGGLDSDGVLKLEGLGRFYDW